MTSGSMGDPWRRYGSRAEVELRRVPRCFMVLVYPARCELCTRRRSSALLAEDGEECRLRVTAEVGADEGDERLLFRPVPSDVDRDVVEGRVTHRVLGVVPSRDQLRDNVEPFRIPAEVVSDLAGEAVHLLRMLQEVHDGLRPLLGVRGDEGLEGGGVASVLHGPSITFRGGTLYRRPELFQNGLVQVSYWWLVI